MKLATLRDGSRDGQLVVVSWDLERYTPAGTVAATMQEALDNWSTLEEGLRDLSTRLDIGQITGSPFVQADCLSPLPRAYQWADGSAYVNHVELVRGARGTPMPESFWTDPLMYQGGSDAFLSPRNPIRLASEDWGIDFEGEIAAVTDDVPMGVAPEDAGSHIKLLMLVNDVSLRNVIPNEYAKGFGFFQSKPSSSFAPVAVTPDELGEAWTGGTIALPLLVSYNDKPFGTARCDVDMTFDLPRLIAHAAGTRPLGPGTIVGSGTVSNKLDGGPGKTIAQGGVGYSCIAEKRTVETLTEGAPRTPFMKFGDRVRIEMKDASGKSIFGAIDQVVEKVGE